MAFAYRCKPSQAKYALDLMATLELDPDVITLMTLRVFTIAGIAAQEGASVKDAVRELWPSECSKLIDVLKREIGDEDMDDRA